MYCKTFTALCDTVENCFLIAWELFCCLLVIITTSPFFVFSLPSSISNAAMTRATPLKSYRKSLMSSFNSSTGSIAYTVMQNSIFVQIFGSKKISILNSKSPKNYKMGFLEFLIYEQKMRFCITVA